MGGQQRGQVGGAVAAPVGLERLVVPAVVAAVEAVVDVGGDVRRLVGEPHHAVVVGRVLAQEPRRRRGDRARQHAGAAPASRRSVALQSSERNTSTSSPSNAEVSASSSRSPRGRPGEQVDHRGGSGAVGRPDEAAHQPQVPDADVHGRSWAIRPSGSSATGEKREQAGGLKAGQVARASALSWASCTEEACSRPVTTRLPAITTVPALVDHEARGEVAVLPGADHEPGSGRARRPAASPSRSSWATSSSAWLIDHSGGYGRRAR